MKKNFCLIALLLFLSAGFSQSPVWERTYRSGTIDSSGYFMGGNQINQIIAHKGKLYAGNSDWCESDTINNPPACEIVRLDAPAAQWQVDTTFTFPCYSGLPDSGFDMNINAMKSFIFTTDLTGSPISPDTLLIAAPGNFIHKSIVYIRDDVTNTWTSSIVSGALSTPFSCRSLGFHKDTISGVCCVFAGIENYGIVKGAYNTLSSGKIQWDSVPEVIPPINERIMGFTVCNNILYAASSHVAGGTAHIYERTDGAGSWTLIDSLTNGTGEDIRGLSAIPNPLGPGQVLWYCWNSKSHRLDPFNAFADTIEYSFPDSLIRHYLGITVRGVLAAYNSNIIQFNIQRDSEDIRVFGIELRYDSAALINSPRPNYHEFATDGRYFVRHQSGPAITYQLEYIVNNSPVIKDTLLSVRTLCVSPFAGDSGEVLYAGGYDCDHIPADRKAWIYRGDFRASTSNGSEQIRTQSEIKVYPNPASYDKGFFVNTSENGDITFYNVLGQILDERKLISGSNQIKLDFADEIVFYKATLQDGTTGNGKLVFLR